MNNFIGNNLRLLRWFHGMSLDDLGEIVTVSRQYLSQLEIGAKKPSGDFIKVLADALDVYPDFFSMPILHEVQEEQCNFRGGFKY